MSYCYCLFAYLFIILIIAFTKISTKYLGIGVWLTLKALGGRAGESTLLLIPLSISFPGIPGYLKDT